MTKHSALPRLTEVQPQRFVFRYGDAAPHLTLRWDDDATTWVVEDGQGRPFRGSVRLLLLRHLTAAFAAAFSPRTRESLARAIEMAEAHDRLTTRDSLEATR